MNDIDITCFRLSYKIRTKPLNFLIVGSYNSKRKGKSQQKKGIKRKRNRNKNKRRMKRKKMATLFKDYVVLDDVIEIYAFNVLKFSKL